MLEALKRSREEVKAGTPSSMDRTKAPSPNFHRIPVSSSATNGSNDGIGAGSIPPMNYSDLSRPPALPYRPAMAPRKTSGTGSVRDNNLTQTYSGSSLSPNVTAEEPSRTPSPEKKRQDAADFATWRGKKNNVIKTFEYAKVTS